MAIVVVGGGGRNVGKTSLVCGLIAGLTEFRWTAVKISAHDHGKPIVVWEETTAGTETDTARYLAAGAERALLVTAEADELGPVVHELMAAQEPGTHLIFESNQVLNYVRPDVCLAVDGGAGAEAKPSFQLVLHQKDATVAVADRDFVVHVAKPVFQLAALERISPEMLAWLRERLNAQSQKESLMPWVKLPAWPD